ncbi:MAG TPA: hypothetical protein DGU45_00405 [Planctomycetes bacterium]|nr:hypothetical protein [Planctomycetota bacterium]
MSDRSPEILESLAFTEVFATEKPPPTNDPKRSATSCRSDVLYRWGEEKTPFMRNGSEMDSSALQNPNAEGQNSGAVSSTSEIQE